MDYEVKSCSRRCAASGRELVPGEECYAVLYETDNGWKREDYALDSWEGASEEAVAWWRTSVPKRDGSGKKQTPNEALLSFFQELHAGGERPETLYVLALLLMRRRVLRLEDARPEDPQTMRFHSAREDVVYPVKAMDLTSAQATAIQEELEKLLYVAAPTTETTDQ